MTGQLLPQRAAENTEACASLALEVEFRGVKGKYKRKGLVGLDQETRARLPVVFQTNGVECMDLTLQ